MIPRASADDIYSFLVDDEDARVCRDIPDDACTDQPRAFTLQLAALTLTKLGDAIASSRLVLAWMLSSIGAPAVYVAMLVPVRESLALVPQLFVAQRLREHAVRKWFWVGGSVGQAMALLAMVPALLYLPAAQAAPAIVALLAVFSTARGVCSVAAKDVLGKTVSKSRRGRLTGLAASTAGLATLAVAVALWSGAATSLGADGSGEIAGFVILLLVAAGLWLLAAALFGGVPEVPGSTEGGGNAVTEALRSLSLLRSDDDFRRFVIARMLLVASAFAIPYVVILLQRGGGGDLGGLAVLLFAEGAAGLASGHLWGLWSDVAAQRVMAAAAALSAAVIGSALALHLFAPDLLGASLVAGSLLFAAAVAHQGARVGRKTYLVDLATAETRASYTAVSNTVIGVFLLLGGGLGVIDAKFGSAAVLLFLMVVSLACTVFSLRLRSVS